jgi:(1->4)-alpha-D-glucan 1-alpha-D-glucosylmutase
MLGAWPLDAEDVPDFQGRLKEHLIKAMREAKLYTSWVEPDAVYEDALLTFVDALFDREVSSEFLDDFSAFQSRIARLGALNSLSQTLIKFTAPGVPDTYQGNEIWDFSFVDPDNRRPVDYQRRSSMLDRIITPDLMRGELLEYLTTTWQKGHPKLFLTQQLLALRRRLPELFAYGSYERCTVEGERTKNVFSYVRTWQNQQILVVAPLLVTAVVDDGATLSAKHRWGDTVVTFPPNLSVEARDLFTGALLPQFTSGPNTVLKVRDVLRTFPCAVIELTENAV